MCSRMIVGGRARIEQRKARAARQLSVDDVGGRHVRVRLEALRLGALGVQRHRPERERRRARRRTVLREDRREAAQRGDHVVDSLRAERRFEGRHRRSGSAAPDRIAKKAVAGAAEQLRPPICNCGPPTPREPWHFAHCASKSSAPTRASPLSGFSSSLTLGPLLPAADEQNDRIDVLGLQRSALVPRPGGHRRVATTVGYRFAQVLVAHRGEEIRLRQARGLVGGVALPRRPMAHGAHAPIELSAADGFRAQRRRRRRMRFGATRERERQSEHRDRHAGYGDRAQHRAGEAHRKSVRHGRRQALSHRLDRREPGVPSVLSVVKA